MKLLFLGDYCNGSQVTPKLAPEVSNLFKSADFICLNFEAPIVSSDLTPAPKTGPAIGQPASVLQTCKERGITHYSLANNHIMDDGQAGLVSTLRHLRDMPFFFFFLNFEQAYQPCYVEASGMRIALLSFAEAQFGVLQDENNSDNAGYAWIDHPRARRAVIEARGKADWVIVQVHAGLEMVDIPLPEWRHRYRELVELGADLVVGHHPHVIQGSESYKGKMIYYSLGNFYMDVMLHQDDQGSGAVLQVTIDQNGLHSVLVPFQVSLVEIGVDLSDKSNTHYQELCQKLADVQTYYTEIQIICNDFWKEIYSRYYEYALVGLGTRPTIKAALLVLQRVVSYIRRRTMDFNANELMLIHNIRIESHRWVVERALASRCKQ